MIHTFSQEDSISINYDGTVSIYTDKTEIPNKGWTTLTYIRYLLDNQTEICDECGEYFPISELEKTYNNHLICGECYSDIYEKCEFCKKSYLFKESKFDTYIASCPKCENECEQCNVCMGVYQKGSACDWYSLSKKICTNCSGMPHAQTPSQKHKYPYSDKVYLQIAAEHPTQRRLEED